MRTWVQPIVLGAFLCVIGGFALLVLGARVGGTIGLLVASGGLLLTALPFALAWHLRYRDTSGWLITWDVSEPLQFSGYVGHRLGFARAYQRGPHTPLEAAWQEWWERLTSDTFTYQAGVEMTLRQHADVPPHQLVHLIRTPGTLPYDPPLFESLQKTPALQLVCQEHWSEFTAIWTIEKPALFTKIRRQGVRVRDNRIVRTAARARGTSHVPPFFLRIDFVRWPELYQQQPSPQHVVLGTHYLEASAAKALEAKLIEIVRDLV